MHPKIILSRIRFDLSYDNKFRPRENSEMVKKKKLNRRNRKYEIEQMKGKLERII